jgi:hypothetical protein
MRKNAYLPCKGLKRNLQGLIKGANSPGSLVGTRCSMARIVKVTQERLNEGEGTCTGHGIAIKVTCNNHRKKKITKYSPKTEIQRREYANLRALLTIFYR